MNKKEEAKRKRYYEDNFALPPECDSLCLARKCFNKYENKGSYSQGIGYTRYYPDFRPVCATRAFHGCPFIRLSPEDKISIEKIKELLTVNKIPGKIKRDFISYLEKNKPDNSGETKTQCQSYSTQSPQATKRDSTHCARNH